MELVSEALQIDKEKIQRGEVVVRKEVITEIQTIQVPVTREVLIVERRPNGHVADVDVLPGNRELRIPISEERVIVSKKPVVNEVVDIKTRSTEAVRTLQEPVRHEELRVEKSGGAEFHEEPNVHKEDDQHRDAA